MEQIEEQLKKLSVIKMTREERTRMRTGVISRVMDTGGVFHFPVASPWSFRHAPLFTKITAAVLIAVFVGGGTLTYASEKSLPGDLLYPIKIEVKENIIEGSLIHSPEDVLNWQQKRLTRRIDEVKQLKKKGTISKKQAAVVTTVVKDHVVQIQSAISTLKDEGKSDIILASTASLLPIVASLNEEAEVKTIANTDTETPKDAPEETLDAKDEAIETPAPTAKSMLMSEPEGEKKDDEAANTSEKKTDSEEKKTDEIKIDLEDATASLEADIKIELKKIEVDVKAVADDSSTETKKQDDKKAVDADKTHLDVNTENTIDTETKASTQTPTPATSTKETTTTKETVEIKTPLVLPPAKLPALH